MKPLLWGADFEMPFAYGWLYLEHIYGQFNKQKSEDLKYIN